MDAPSSSPRRSLLHFLLLGSILFLGDRLLSRQAAPEIVITAERIEQLVADAKLDAGIEVEGEQLQNLIEGEIDGELLVARAVELGLPFEEPSRGRLAELARFLGEDGSEEELVERALALGLHRRDPEARQRLQDVVVARITAADLEYGEGEVPPDPELEEMLRQAPEIYTRPERFLLTQVFVAGPGTQTSERESESSLARAHRLREELIADDAGPERAPAVSDPGPLPVDLEPLTRRQILLRFGDDAAEALDTLPLRQWSEPVPVTNGAHLFWLHERQPARLPALEEVRDQVLRHWRLARQEARLTVALMELRERYAVTVEQPPGAEP